MSGKDKHSFFRRTGLSIVLLLLMLVSLAGQFFTGRSENNEERKESGVPELSISAYARSGHFIQATFENWESEFLQMALYVLLTVSLRQAGSSESKKLDGKEEVDRDPRPHPDAPWPVRKGGIWVKIYSNSLSMAFVLLFLVSFGLHFYGSLRNHNEEQAREHLPADNWQTYISAPKFWFESFQNWQSEFLAVASIVLLSVWLRQKGSPESKPVDAPYAETGSG
jgi:flagellar basal body-associated protein FliL